MSEFDDVAEKGSTDQELVAARRRLAREVVGLVTRLSDFTATNEGSGARSWDVARFPRYKRERSGLVTLVDTVQLVQYAAEPRRQHVLLMDTRTLEDSIGGIKQGVSHDIVFDPTQPEDLSIQREFFTLDSAPVVDRPAPGSTDEANERLVNDADVTAWQQELYGETDLSDDTDALYGLAHWIAQRTQQISDPDVLDLRFEAGA